MDATNGIVRRSVNLNWHDLPLRALLEERYGLPVYVANDSQVAALGEYTFGDGPGVENLVVVKVGQGIGAGIVLNGQIFHGETFGAGEIGHVAVVANGRQCRCGNFGCLETVASARDYQPGPISRYQRSGLSPQPFCRQPRRDHDRDYLPGDGGR